MILTGSAIKSAVRQGRITIDPFDPADIRPNSYNYHLGDTLLAHGKAGQHSRRIKLKPEGYVLKPGQVYLGATYEKMGSDYFASLVLGNTAIGSLGVFLDITADLGHIGCCSHWTLEITVVQPVRIYPRMSIGQISFWKTDHTSTHRYQGRYHGDSKPVANRDGALIEREQHS